MSMIYNGKNTFESKYYID